MEEMIAYCGIACNECPALIATRNDDNGKRSEVAEQWSKMYNTDVKPEEVNCSGCLSGDGTLYKHCQVCEIRKCGKDKDVQNCGHCTDYPCNKLDWIFKVEPEAKRRLDGVRKV